MSFLNVICLLNVLYILVKYHKNILTCFKVMVCTKVLQFWRQGEITHGPSQLELSFFVLDTPTKCPLQPDSFLKIAQRVVRNYWVHNNMFMDRQGAGLIFPYISVEHFKNLLVRNHLTDFSII